MITFSIEGELPVVNADLSEVMRAVALLMEESVKLNFIEGGRPVHWEATKRGTRAFYPFGDLFYSIRKISGATWAEVSAGDNLPYARIQQAGGEFNVPITQQSRKFFWAMFFKTGDPKWQWMALSNKSSFHIRIPARPYMMFQDEDVEKILSLIGGGIVQFDVSHGLYSNVKYEPVFGGG